MLGTEDRGLV